MTTWLEAELVATRIDGRYAWSLKNTDGGWRTSCSWQLDTTVSASTAVWWRIAVPRLVSRLLGLSGGSLRAGNVIEMPKVHGTRGRIYDDSDDDQPAFSSASEPLATLVEKIRFDGIGPITIQLGQTKGVFSEQAARLPAGMRQHAATEPALDWGVFLIDGQYTVIAAYDDATETLSRAVSVPIVNLPWTNQPGAVDVSRPYGSSDPIEVKQVMMFSGKFRDIIKDLLYSTGVTAYNEVDHDVLPYGSGLGIPWELLGDDFDEGVDSLPGADNELLIVLDKPTKFEDVLRADLMMRRTHLIFRDGGFRFVCWSTPTVNRATYALTEDNKYEPAGRPHQRTASRLDSHWAKPIVKIEYNRSLKDETYRDSLTIEDRTAIDDNSGKGDTITIKARNTYGEFAETEASIMALAPELISWHAFFSRPIRTMRRSIGIFHFFNFAVGDVVTVSDDFARDPTTGERGTTTRAALVTGHSWTAGGPQAGNPRSISPMGGEVTLAMVDLEGRVRDYAPAAEIDETADAGGFASGYNSGTSTIRVKTSAHSNSAEAAIAPDLTYFSAGDKIRIVEIDPDDTAAPATWLRTIQSITNLTDFVLDSALSSPAWDDTKLYRVIPDLYADAVADQRVEAFQANDTTGIIDELGAPASYGEHPIILLADAEATTALPERPSVYGYGDGAPRDVGYEKGLLRSAQNLIEYKTAISSPFFFRSARTATPSGTTPWGDTITTHLLGARPVFLQAKDWNADNVRYISVAPLMRSTDGTSTSLTVTLSQEPPAPDGYRQPGPHVSVTFSGVTSTTMAVPTAQLLDLSVIRDSGLAYIAIRGVAKCETWGLSEYLMTERRLR